MIDDLKRRLANNDKQLENLLMKKKLKIKFWKSEKALAMQILEQEGLPKKKYNGAIMIINGACFGSKSLYLRGCEASFDFDISAKSFESNQDRDAYFDKITQAITDELFTSDGELKVGEICEVRINVDCPWKTYKMLAILPEGYGNRYIASICDEKSYWMAFRDARPIAKRTEPKIKTNGEIVIYTWEKE